MRVHQELLQLVGGEVVARHVVERLGARLGFAQLDPDGCAIAERNVGFERDVALRLGAADPGGRDAHRLGLEHVLELGHRRTHRLGPDIMVSPPDFDGMVERFRAAGQSRALGEALLDQALVAGIGNMWKAEALFAAGLKPWVHLRDVNDDQLREVLAAAARLMQAPRRRGGHRVYRRAGRPCTRCGTPIRSWPQGDDARMAYWCPTCQAGTEPRGA